MFTHFDGTGGCEWLGGALNAFVSHYNATIGTDYELTKCLDIVKISGATPKEPEVLLTDRATGNQMVIERKSVVWPKTYIHQHQLEHEFANLIWKVANAAFLDDSYTLTVNQREFSRLTSRQIREAGNEIGDQVSRLSPTQLPVRKKGLISWSLRKSAPGEEETERRGIVVSQVGEMSFDDPDFDEARAGMPAEIQAQLTAAAAKFSEYSNHLRLVLLDFYSNELWEDDVPPMMNAILVPDTVDEIWRTIRDWVSEDEYEVGYERLFQKKKS